MTGHVDATRRPLVHITLRGPFGFEVVEAGFNGHLSFPVSLAYRLGLTRHGVQYVELGDGKSAVEPTFVVEIEWAAGKRRCVACGSSLQEYLIGTALLDGHKLVIDFGPARSVEVQ